MPISVLIVDANRKWAMNFVTFLTQNRYAARSAAGMPMAQIACRAYRPRVLWLDLEPVGGEEPVDAGLLAGSCGTDPALIVTGLTSPKMERRLGALVPAAILEKPVSLRRALETVTLLCGRKGARGGDASSAGAAGAGWPTPASTAMPAPPFVKSPNTVAAGE